MSKDAKNAVRQRSQKGMSRRKTSAKNNKLNNDVSLNISQASSTSTSSASLETSVNDSIDSWVNLRDPNILSRITDMQNTLHEDKHSNILDNKIQSQDVGNQTDNICPHLFKSKLKKHKVPILRKKSKERKVTTRKKQMFTPLTMPINIAPANVALATVASTITPATVASTIAPATVGSTTIAPVAVASVTPVTVAPVITTTTTVAPATVAFMIETSKNQSTSTQFVDMPQLCSSQSIPIIPGHISEMIYPNVPNSELLKAFNDYWSAQVSHCAICATFASCTSGNSRMMPPDWKYCKSAMLPESTPIWVKK